MAERGNMRAVTAVSVAVLATAACSPPGRLPPNQAHLAAPGIVVPDSVAGRLASMCVAQLPDRPPEPVEGIWTPTAADIATFEALLVLWLQDLRWQRPGNGPDRPLNRYQGYYTGFVRQQHRVVCGGFWDLKAQPALPTDRGLPAFLSDSRWRMFRVVFDPADSSFSAMRNAGAVCVGACDGWRRPLTSPPN